MMNKQYRMRDLIDVNAKRRVIRFFVYENGKPLFHGIYLDMAISFGTAEKAAEYCKELREIAEPGFRYYFKPIAI